MNRDHTSPSSLTWVTTCAALHNVCLPAGDVLEPEDDVDGVQVPPPCPGRNEQQGQGARERLAAQRPAPVQPEQLLHQRERGEGQVEMVVCVEKEDYSFTWLYMVLYLEAGDNPISCHSYMLRILQTRRQHGEYHRLVQELRLDGERFQRYFRLDRAQFDELLTRVGPRITRQDTNWRSPITTESMWLFPSKSGSLFFNYKGTYSIVLLAVVDARYRFRVVDVGTYGRRSDGGTLASSKFGKALQNGRLDLPEDRLLPEAEHLGCQPHVFVADEAFPLQRHLMRPFPGSNLSRRNRVFNYRLSRARMIVENTFSILSAQWRMYRRVIGTSPGNVEKCVKAT
ncbi:hypothetical protein AAFF_G00026110 [Aldrovandia affinis]|uniref:DDE Tnp4 domain-containing protein n=1 Tax=Aldrovandia affinis TaxID=143900 RepID=A0AAD7R2D4_9TELE|nr:hypothetical protein AAFF_G00026110 [Aldrovandia affinis]